MTDVKPKNKWCFDCNVVRTIEVEDEPKDCEEPTAESPLPQAK